LTVHAATAHGRLKEQQDGNRGTTVSAAHHVATLSEARQMPTAKVFSGISQSPQSSVKAKITIRPRPLLPVSVYYSLTVLPLDTA